MKKSYITRLLALLLALIMAFSLGTVALAVDGEAGGAEEGTVTATKTLRMNPDGSYALDRDGNYIVDITVSGVPYTQEVQSAVDVVLVIDCSGSMSEGRFNCPGKASDIYWNDDWDWEADHWQCGICGKNLGYSHTKPTSCSGHLDRMDAAKVAGKNFVNALLPSGTQNRVAVVGFSGRSGGTGNHAIDAWCNLTDTAATANNTIDRLWAGGGTNYTAALAKAQNILNGRSDKTRPAYVVFISDGAPGASGDGQNDPQWNGSVQAKALKDAGVTLYTIGINLTDSAGAYLKSLASNNCYVNLKGSNLFTDLNDILTEWGKTISSVAAGKNATIVDLVNLTDVTLAALPEGSPLTWDEEHGTLTWNVGEITSTPKTASFSVAPNAYAEGKNGCLHTNTGITLTYTDGKSGEQKEIKDFGDPAIELPSLTVSKSFSGLSDSDLPESVTVLLKNGQNILYRAILTADSEYTAEIEHIAFGSYQVEETGHAVYGYDCSMALSGVIVDAQNQQQIVLPATAAAAALTLGVTNTYTEKEATEGTLTITKTVTGLQQGDALSEGFAILLTAEDGAELAYELTLSNAVEQNGVYTWTKENVPFGTYTVEEQNADVNGYELTPTVPETFEFDATNTTLALTNKYNKQITVTFQVDGGTWDGGGAAPKQHTLTLSDSGQAALGDIIPTGMQPDDDHKSFGAWDAEFDASTLLTEDTVYTYTFDPKPTAAQVTVTKTFVGLPEGVTPVASGEQSFVISVQGGNNTYECTLENADSVVKNNDGNAVYTWTLEVPFDSYAVSEENEEITGYRLTASTVTPDSFTVDRDDNPTQSVDLTNSYATTPVRFYLHDAAFDSITDTRYAKDVFSNPAWLAVFPGYAYLTSSNTEQIPDAEHIGEQVALGEGETWQSWLAANVGTVDETALKIAALKANGTLENDADDELAAAEAAKYDLVYEEITNNSDVLYEFDNESGEYTPTEPNQASFHVHVKLVEKTTPGEDKITVTFRVENGTWWDGGNADKTVELTLVDGKAKLVATDIPVNMKPDTGYADGAWDVEPSTTTELTEDTTYTYRFAQEQPGEDTVIEIPFTKVVTKGGKTAPGKQTFAFNVELLAMVDTGDELKTEVLPETAYTVEGNEVKTDGAGEFDGVIRVTIKDGVNWTWLRITEQDGKTKNWTYDDNYWEVGYELPAALLLATTLEAPLYAMHYTADGEWFGEPVNITAGNGITFENDYTYNGGGNHDDNDRYTVIYESNGGTKYMNEIYAAGATVVLDKKPIRANYTFAGWYTDEELTERVTKFTMPSHNVTVYARWTTTTVPAILNGDDHFAYVVGYEDGTVRPNGNITRAEVATIFFRLLTAEARDGNLTRSNPFTDVPADAWYCAPVSTMAKLGLINGRTSTTFVPNAPITRAEFAAICARFDYSIDSSLGTFSDVIGHWAEEETDRAASLGWITGYEDGTFHPDQYITRAEAMTIINRVLHRLPETKDDLHEDMTVWPDNADPAAWYYLAVQEATNSHDFARKTDDLHERWTRLTTAPDWTRYEK